MKNWIANKLMRFADAITRFAWSLADRDGSQEPPRNSRAELLVAAYELQATLDPKLYQLIGRACKVIALRDLQITRFRQLVAEHFTVPKGWDDRARALILSPRWEEPK